MSTGRFVFVGMVALAQRRTARRVVQSLRFAGSIAAARYRRACLARRLPTCATLSAGAISSYFAHARSAVAFSGMWAQPGKCGLKIRSSDRDVTVRPGPGPPRAPFDC